MLLITVMSWLNKMDCNPRPTLGTPKCNNDSLTLSLYGDREKAAPCQWGKSITSGHLEGHAEKLCPFQCAGCVIAYMCANTSLFVFVDGLNENKERCESALRQLV